MKMQPAYEWDSLLGKVPDTEIADRFGVHFNTVYRRRKKLAIPAMLRRVEAPYRHWVGRVPDATISRCWGVTAKAVADTRRRMKRDADLERIRAEVAEERAAVVAYLVKCGLIGAAEGVREGDHRRERTP